MVYFVTTLILMATVAWFFWWARKGLRPFGWKQWALRIVVAMPLFISGFAHFTRTALFAGIIPPVFHYREQLVMISGALELAGAVGLLVPSFTRVASFCLPCLLVAVFPANVYAAHRNIGGLQMPGVPLRLAMQVVYILLLLIAGWGARSTGSRADS